MGLVVAVVGVVLIAVGVVGEELAGVQEVAVNLESLVRGVHGAKGDGQAWVGLGPGSGEDVESFDWKEGGVDCRHLRRRADPDDADVVLEAGNWLAGDLCCAAGWFVAVLQSCLKGLADRELLRSGFVVDGGVLFGIDVAFGKGAPVAHTLATEPFQSIDHRAM